MTVATVIWSTVCVMTFLFARTTQALDYHSFFTFLLGPFAFVFELAYLLFIVLILAVFGAAAGAIGETLFQWPRLLGTLCLAAGIGFVTMYGNNSVERLFKWVSIFLYTIYALFVALALTKFGHNVLASFSARSSMNGWVIGGMTYAGYNIIGAVVILPIVRHMTCTRDAITAGVLAGPLAMLPAFLFFICMCAFYPQIRAETLPSDFLLRHMNFPAFHLAFQLMVFSALLESGVGSVHAINERIASSYRARSSRPLPNSARLATAAMIICISMFLADRFGLVILIAKGYRALAYVLIVVYVLPLLSYGSWRLWRQARAPAI